MEKAINIGKQLEKLKIFSSFVSYFVKHLSKNCFFIQSFTKSDNIGSSLTDKSSKLFKNMPINFFSGI